jgi:hypothetical protein
MNTESPDELDRLIGDWAASREADEQHTSRLANQILAAARNKPVPASIGAAPMSYAFWGDKLMIGGGGLLSLLILAGGVLFYNLTTVPPGGPQPRRPIAAAPDTSPPDASLGAAVMAAKRQLLTETNALFDDRLAWIADGEHEVSLEVREQAAQDDGEFMLVRVVVAQRTSPDSPWSTVWQTDVISRSEALVEVTPTQLDGSTLALWTYRLPDGKVAVDMDLMLDQNTWTQVSSSTVLHAGQPTRVGCSTSCALTSIEGGAEQCVFQTVMPLSSSKT